MKEASVAGESPDRSKQRESSAEQTSGSGGAVPEPRDPRFAVARESESRGGVDTVTKVLSVREAPAERETPADDGNGDEHDAAHGDTHSGENSGENRSGAADGGSETDGTGETGLRAAVAAWVRPGDSADAEPAEDAAESRPGASEPEAEGSVDIPAPSRPANAPQAPTASEDETGAPEAEADVEPDASPMEDAGPEADAGPNTGQADAGPDGDREDDAGPAEGSADEDAGNGSTAARAGADDPEDGDKAPKDGGKSPDGGRTAEDDGKTTEGGDKPAKDSGKTAGDGDKAPEGSGDTTGDDGKSAEDDGKAAAPVQDSPTAVFKAVRAPEKPQVDQPTTTLKVGGTGKPAAPEPESERTSTFVALKPLDDPAARKPRPAPAEATAQAPRLGPERTAQQPLPPKPPLDLLAELTNTPPPPQTPVRTLIRRVKIWTPLVLLLVVVFAVVQAFRPLPSPRLDLTAQQTYTFDGGKASLPWPSAGEGALDVQGIGSFGSSGTQRSVPIASVAKVMTAYLILRDHPLKGSGEGPKINVDKRAEDQATADGESTVEVRAGDSITEREALEGVLIASANNVARLLARWDAGSEKAFVAKMNAAAKDLGMTRTTYTDPSGLEKTTVSTAVDQVKLAKAAMQDPAFREVAQMMEYTDYKGTTHSNWNRLVGSNGVIGIKTGTTTAAGGNLVFAAVKEVGDETKTIVGAVLGQGPGGADNTILSGALDAADKLIRAAQDALQAATILKKGDVVGYVDDGLGGRTPVVITKDVPAVGWAGLQVRLSFAADNVPHTAKAGTTVGTLTVGDGTSGAVKVPVALQQDLAEPGFTDKLTRIT
ncbi:D-alanyl-D-alanine carboxypeptidase [Streptomyces sp. NPDC006012]|uniref:D-alanyl-D-alanine carboxypeptidase n=1 Tax=Streptomyces sp. NPDC006012 TaxID=3364739 RepID=UPI0036915B6C